MDEAGRSGVDALLDEVLEVLGDMVEVTCPSMRPLWLDLTRGMRAEMLEEPVAIPAYPPHLLQAGKASRSKYRALAGWRHAVVWQDLLDAGDGGRLEALELIYFQPYPEDRPPYAYSARSSAAPGVSTDASIARVRQVARREARDTLVRLASRWIELFEAGSKAAAYSREFLALSRRASLRDVLKLESADAALFSSDPAVLRQELLG